MILKNTMKMVFFSPPELKGTVVLNFVDNLSYLYSAAIKQEADKQHGGIYSPPLAPFYILIFSC